ncbi:MAG: hypothetical protein IPG59_10405 [Candidatus Melainabacteria bacterium]|nr:MAG: hypothetical protein IPG59_10405 [Candidatus Melainabacteria bacterium]
MIVKRPTIAHAIALLAILSLSVGQTLAPSAQTQAATSSNKKSKRKHKPSYTNMSLVPPPPPSIAIPEGMLLAVPPPAILAAGFAPSQPSFTPYQPMPMHSPTHRCGHCGFSDSSLLSPAVGNTSPYFKPFPRRTFFNADSMTSMSVSRSRKTRSERQTKRFKKRKCIFTNR